MTATKQTSSKRSQANKIYIATPVAVTARYGPEAAMFLAQAAYLTRRHGGAFHLPMRGTDDELGWDQIVGSPRRQRRIRARLKADGLLSTWLDGIPCRRWYEIDLGRYDRLLAGDASDDETRAPEVSDRHRKERAPATPGRDDMSAQAVPNGQRQRSPNGSAYYKKINKETNTVPRTRARDSEVVYDGEPPQPPPPVADMIDAYAARARHPEQYRAALVRRWREGDLHVDRIPDAVIERHARRGESYEEASARVRRLCAGPP